jgi:chromosome segregation ATPase
LQKKSEDVESRLTAARASATAESAAELEKLEKLAADRLRIGQNWKKRSDDLNITLESQKTSLESQKTSLAEREQALNTANERIAALEKEIVDVKGKLSEVERKLGDAERGNTLKDSTVSRLQSELGALRANRPAQVDSSALVSAITCLISSMR